MDATAARSRAAGVIRDWLIDEAGFLGSTALVLENLCEVGKFELKGFARPQSVYALADRGVTQPS